MNNSNSGAGILALVILFIIGAIGACSFTQIDPGMVGVASLFGKPTEVITNGTHWINPLATVQEYDTRWQILNEQNVDVPSQDQLTTRIDISVQYRIIGSEAMKIFLETGDEKQLADVHLHPRLRSVLREQGKSIERAEDFFREDTQVRLQLAIQEELGRAWAKIGVEVGDPMLRNIALPDFINSAVEKKKEREQATDQQRAELARFKVEQEQKLAAADAERQAAEQEALKIKLLADAQAYQIGAQGKALRENPEVLRLQWIERWSGQLPKVMAGENQLLISPTGL